MYNERVEQLHCLSYIKGAFELSFSGGNKNEKNSLWELFVLVHLQN